MARCADPPEGCVPTLELAVFRLEGGECPTCGAHGIQPGRYAEYDCPSCDRGRLDQILTKGHPERMEQVRHDFGA